MNTKKLICLALCACSLLTACFTACSKNDSATPDEVSAAVEQYETDTQASTTLSDAENETTQSSTKTTEKKDKDNKKNSSSNSSDSSSNSSSNNSSDSSSSNKRPDGLNVDNSNGSPGLGEAKRCTITVGNKGYVKNVGDTFTYTFYLTTPKEIENIQAQVSYDSAMLKIKNTQNNTMFPVLGSSAVCNTKIKDTILFNASNLDGYNFTKKAKLITINFEVINTGGTSISTAIEFMDEIGGEVSYADSFVLSSKVKTEETLR